MASPSPFGLTQAHFFDTHPHHSLYNQFQDWNAVSARAAEIPLPSAPGLPSHLSGVYPAPSYSKVPGLR